MGSNFLVDSGVGRVGASHVSSWNGRTASNFPCQCFSDCTSKLTDHNHAMAKMDRLRNSSFWSLSRIHFSRSRPHEYRDEYLFTGLVNERFPRLWPRVVHHEMVLHFHVVRAVALRFGLVFHPAYRIYRARTWNLSSFRGLCGLKLYHRN